MKTLNASMMVVGALLLGACSSVLENSCRGVECRELGANNQQLTIWWTPVLRHGTDGYSTVSLDE